MLTCMQPRPSWWEHIHFFNVLSFGRRRFPFRFWPFLFGWILWILIFVYLYFWRVRVETSAQLFLIFFYLLLFPLVWGYRWFDRIARTLFWHDTAKTLGWSYTPAAAIPENQGILFQRGSNRKALHILTGTLAGRPVKLFEYEYSERVGDDKIRYRYTILSFAFRGSFPHLYLDRLKNGPGNVVGEHIPLPSDFEKKFALYAPREYEIEALQIFTPDLLYRILELGIPYDVEFAQGNLCVIIQGSILNADVLNERLATAEGIATLFGPILDKAEYTTITGRDALLKNAPPATHLFP